MANKTSQHILSTAANLLGFCLLVITSLHVSSIAESSLIDELTVVNAVLLIFSCLFSFISIRTTNPKKAQRLETVADCLFVAYPLGILFIILLIAFNFIN